MREIRLERPLEPANELESLLLAHPSLALRSLSAAVSDGKYTSVNLMQGSPAALAAFRKRYVERPPRQVRWIEVLDEGRGKLMFYEVELSGEHPTDISQLVHRELGAETVVRVEKTHAGVVWSLLTFRDDRLPGFFARLKEVGGGLVRTLDRPAPWYEVIAHARPRMPARDAEVGPLPEAVLRTAVRMGFYEQPKRCGIEDVAKKLRLPRSTTHYLLKQAERSVLVRHVEGGAPSSRP